MDDGDSVDRQGAVPLNGAAEGWHDEHGHEEEIVAGTDLLYRRLSPEAVNPDGTANSLAYNLRPNEPWLSVDVARLTTEDAAMVKKPDFGLGVIRADVARSLGLTVELVEDPDDPNHKAHAKIEGNLSKTQRQQLARATTVLRRPTAPRK